MTFIGIDLAASPRRRTGLALIDGQQVIVSVARADEEIIRFVLSSGPKVVAIDAPLSLGKGPYRDFERKAIKEGYRLLPSTLRSMRDLSLRAQRLVSVISGAGAEVIETHPRSALRSGSCRSYAEVLQALGLRPPLNVNRDEADAVVAAAIALCYFKGAYTSIVGSEGELVLLPKGLCGPPRHVEGA